jgi:LPXTG-motif cell wall-anchored protein
MSVMAVALVALGLPLVTMSAASAHIPTYGASCDGVWVKGTNYNPNEANYLKIQIDNGVPVVQKFGDAGLLTVPVPKDDALVHSWHVWVLTPNTSYRLDESGTVGPCGFKNVTAALWSATTPTCIAAGALVPATEPEGVIATQSPAGTGPGNYTITFTPKAGYAIVGAKSQSITVLPKLTGDQCATLVQPVSPTVTTHCTGPGTGAGSFTLPVSGNGITYTSSGMVVTATADDTHKFGTTLPTGWTPVDSHHATYLVHYPTSYPECVIEIPVPTPPAATNATCDTDGTLTVAPTEHVITTVDNAVLQGQTVFGKGSHVIVYSPAPGYKFAGEVQTSFPIDVPAKTGNCPTSVVSPTVTQSVCTGQGTHSDPVIKLGDVEGDHVSYVYDAATHLVTAKPDTGYALANLPTGWTLQENRTATYVVTLTDPGTCLVTVVSPPTTSPVVQVQPPKAHHPMVLPNTGGPNQWLALAGLVLLLGGGALVSRERRLRRSEG